MPREQAVLHGLISSQKGKYNNETNQRENQMTIDKEKTVSTCKNEEVLRNDADDSLKIKGKLTYLNNRGTNTSANYRR